MIKEPKGKKNKKIMPLTLKMKRQIKAGSQDEKYWRTPKGVNKDKKRPMQTGAPIEPVPLGPKSENEAKKLAEQTKQPVIFNPVVDPNYVPLFGTPKEGIFTPDEQVVGDELVINLPDNLTQVGRPKGK